MQIIISFNSRILQILHWQDTKTREIKYINSFVNSVESEEIERNYIAKVKE